MMLRWTSWAVAGCLHLDLLFIHGLSKAEIDAHSGDDGYISIHTLVEEANAEYTMLLSSGHWGPWGKGNLGAAPEALFSCNAAKILFARPNVWVHPFHFVV